MEKLALAMVIAVQKFRHYILLRTTVVYVDSNPMYYVLTCQVLGGKYSRWIMILQEFELEFAKSASNKSLIFAELNVTFPILLRLQSPLIHFPMNHCFSLVRPIHGMETSFCISRPYNTILLPLEMNVHTFASKPKAILF